MRALGALLSVLVLLGSGVAPADPVPGDEGFTAAVSPQGGTRNPALLRAEPGDIAVTAAGEYGFPVFWRHE
ncbi:hypothetical protein [Lentzea aerocolonigenes]|uniref:hypothetical protein n=1 Tax=Lentzea aerocolonigenes TaxID=68170 RepID=UPI0012E18738|nr:hypothetical protein [Lentzea aerocolonigenes]